MRPPTPICLTKDTDIGRYLHVRVTYRDGANLEDDPVTDVDERDDIMDPVAADAQEDADRAIFT